MGRDDSMKSQISQDPSRKTDNQSWQSRRRILGRIIDQFRARIDQNTQHLGSGTIMETYGNASGYFIMTLTGCH